MNQLIDEALQRARNPEPLRCPVSGEQVYAPLDKLCIGLYNKSIPYLDDEGPEAKQLLELASLL